jgi:hypothetical protein
MPSTFKEMRIHERLETMNGTLARVRGLNRKLAITLAVGGLALMAIGVASASSARPSSSNVITGTRSIDGYKVGAPWSAARRIFGFPKASSQSGTTCTARWTNGVSLSWYRTLPYSKWTRACVRFSRAKVGEATLAGPTWRTDKGLRVGAPQSQVKKLYKAATRKNSGGYAVWTLAKASRSSLQAWVKRGRIAYFRIVRT